MLFIYSFTMCLSNVNASDASGNRLGTSTSKMKQFPPPWEGSSYCVLLCSQEPLLAPAIAPAAAWLWCPAHPGQAPW